VTRNKAWEKNKPLKLYHGHLLQIDSPEFSYWITKTAKQY